MKKKLIHISILLCLPLFLWGKAPHFQIGVAPALVMFGDALGGGLILFVDYPISHFLGISWPIKARAVGFGEMSGTTNTSFQNMALGIGISTFWSFPDLSALSIEGGIDILPSIYHFTYNTSKGNGTQSGIGSILVPYAATWYTLSSKWAIRMDIGYHMGIYDSFFSYFITSLGVTYVF